MKILALLVLGLGMTNIAFAKDEAPSAGGSVQGLKYSGIILYSTASKVDTDISGGGNTLTSSEKSSAGFGFGFSASKMDVNKLGFDVGLTYELERTIDSSSGALNGVSFSSDYTNKPTITVITLTANANYLLDSGVYIFGGINFPKFDLKSDIIDASGKIGYQAGVGYQANAHWNIEGYLRKVNTKLDYNDGTTTGSGDGKFDGIILAAKYSFN
jgi:hypothetical protein